MSRLAAYEAARRCAAVLFPNRCPFCDGICGGADYGHETCFAELPFLKEPPEVPAGLSALYAVCSYEGTARQAVIKYKAGSYVYSAEAFAVLMIEQLGEDIRRADAIVPVPSTIDSFLDRGYTPGGKLAALISLRSGIPVKRALVTSPKKTNQKLLGAQQRRENAKGAFRLKKHADLTGKRVLLIDDVCTTGSTLSACAELLKKAGAEEVFAAVFTKTRK